MSPAPAHWFEPTEYAVPELHWLLLHLEDRPVVVEQATDLPSDVVKPQVLKLVKECRDLQDLFETKNIPWAGYDAVRESIERTLSWYVTCAELKRRGGPKHPSQKTWDGPRYAHQGVGADSADKVRSEILPSGSRRRLGLNLASPDGAAVGPDLVGAAPWLEGQVVGEADLVRSTPSELVEKTNEKSGTGVLECPLCGFAENYSLAKTNSKRAAKARMSRHLKNTRTDKDRHMILYSRVSKRGQQVH